MENTGRNLNMATVKDDLLASGSNKRYVNLAHLLRMRIRAGDYRPGDRLPAIDQLARQFNTAVVTARQALALLERDGLVQRRQGVGTFVLDDAVAPVGLELPLDQDWSGIRALWGASQVRILAERDRVECPPDYAQHGQPADAYFYMRRVHEAQGIPYTVADIYIDREVYRKAPKRFRHEIALHVLPQLLPQRKLEAKWLDIAVGAPVVIMKRVVRDESGRIIYAGTPVYRGDIVRLDRTFKL